MEGVPQNASKIFDIIWKIWYDIDRFLDRVSKTIAETLKVEAFI